MGGESGTAILVATGADVGAACGWGGGGGGGGGGVRTGDEGCCGAEGATGTSCCCPELAS